MTNATTIKPEIERLENLLAVHSPLPSVKGTSQLVPNVQVMLDHLPLPIPGAQYHSALLGLKLKNDEGFPVTLTMPNRCQVLRWVVEKNGVVIDHSPMCSMIYDPVQLKLPAKFADLAYEAINLDRAKYETGGYTLKVWFWGIESHSEFFVEKLPKDKLSKEGQQFAAQEEKSKAVKEFSMI